MSTVAIVASVLVAAAVVGWQIESQLAKIVSLLGRLIGDIQEVKHQLEGIASDVSAIQLDVSRHTDDDDDFGFGALGESEDNREEGADDPL